MIHPRAVLLDGDHALSMFLDSLFLALGYSASVTNPVELLVEESVAKVLVLSGLLAGRFVERLVESFIF